ncbi:ShlB/FhaC/HecB family hemolysin secretion/activation protein [Burkholderia cenocepacia]|nr:ShlB/FhaC/HecB family hemolysin secretion/activation protein [Burkholderia cenocepacia]
MHFSTCRQPEEFISVKPLLYTPAKNRIKRAPSIAPWEKGKIPDSHDASGTSRPSSGPTPGNHEHFRRLQKIRQDKWNAICLSYLFNINRLRSPLISDGSRYIDLTKQEAAQGTRKDRVDIRFIYRIRKPRRSRPTHETVEYLVSSWSTPSVNATFKCKGIRNVSGSGQNTRYALGIAALLLLPALVRAQTHVPSAGQSLRDVETVRPSLPAATRPDIDLPRTETPQETDRDTGPHVTVHAFNLEGNTVFTAAQLKPVLADLVGRDLSFGELQQAANRITAYYRERGYVLARAYLPQQDIDSGVVRIAVTEGRYGKVELHNRTRVLDRALRQPLAVLEPGDAVRGAPLERSLMLLDEIPGVNAKGTLRAGAEPGTTDLVIDAERGPFATGSIDLDNFGDPLTGRYRATGSIDVNTPLRLGDRFSLRGLISNKNQRYYRTAYQVPVGPASTRIGIAYSDMNYRLGGEFRELGFRGGANVRSVFVTQPLVRSRRASIDVRLAYDNKHLRDDYGAFDIVSDKRVDLWSIGISGNSEDTLLGGGRSGFSVSVGNGRMSGNDPLEANRFAKTHGRFTTLNVSALRLQTLGARMQFFTQFSAQLSSRNLDASEKFSLGGPYGVRGYALGAGSGDNGWLASAELRYLATPGWQISTFIDTGHVQFNKQPWTRERNGVQLSSIGIGTTWFGTGRQVSVTAALPLGNTEKVVTVTRSPSVWLQAAQYF